MVFRLVLTFLLAFAALEADAGLPFMSETVSWDEDVLRTDGQIVTIHRTVTYGADGYGRSGRGQMKEQTIRFLHHGKTIEWDNRDRWPIYMPDILDFVDDVPVLIMPVHRWGPCERYGFPQEGLVAFGYRAKSRLSFTASPNGPESESPSQHARDSILGRIQGQTHSGTLLDAFRITLPAIDKFFAEGKWPMIWEVVPADGQLRLSLGNYSYPATANLGGVLEQRLDYTLRLPK